MTDPDELRHHIAVSTLNAVQSRAHCSCRWRGPRRFLPDTAGRDATRHLEQAIRARAAQWRI